MRNSFRLGSYLVLYIERTFTSHRDYTRETQDGQYSNDQINTINKFPYSSLSHAEAQSHMKS